MVCIGHQALHPSTEDKRGIVARAVVCRGVRVVLAALLLSLAKIQKEREGEECR
jgi:hypothetical protein